jgi:hypothetical protein
MPGQGDRSRSLSWQTGAIHGGDRNYNYAVYTAMMKILLLDLDGTIRETISGQSFINDPDDQKLGAKRWRSQFDSISGIAGEVRRSL